MQKKLKILFLCTGNSCRSQMAQGFANVLKGDEIKAYSAGIETHGLNPHAVTVMAEAGIDISGHKSQHLDAFKDLDPDYVITVCSHAHETCPWFPGTARVVHAGFDDPPALAENASTHKQVLSCYRKVRDEIKAYIMTLPQALLKQDG